MLHTGHPIRSYTNLLTFAIIHGRAQQVAAVQAHVQAAQTGWGQANAYQASVLIFNHHRIEAARFLRDAHLWMKEGYQCT
jgi:hypothetical protein